MAKSFKVLFVSSEVYPFAKESGIADVSHSLPLAIRELQHDIRVICPKYGVLNERRSKIHNVSRLRDVEIAVGDKTELANIKSATIISKKNKVQVYFSSNQDYFEQRKGIYHDPINWSAYPDNAERFIFFAKSALETCVRLKWIPDIIHCNDWQTALIPAFMKNNYAGKFNKTKVVFTIHNFYRQGVFPLEELLKTELSNELKEVFIHKDMMNFLKGGLELSNYITTVSPSYANELLDDTTYGNELNYVLKSKVGYFKGILNGIDDYIWNPRRDKLIHQKLEDDFDDFKISNKVFLQRQFGLPVAPEKPLLGFIPRIGYQKGVSLLIETAEKILNNDLQILLLGQGDNELKIQLAEIEKKYPEKFKAVFAFDEDLSHQIEAGADFLMLPSMYEPCGLNVMYSMKYGTIPIVRHTGGMKDSTENYNDATQTGNSIVFTNYDKKDFSDAISRAVNLYSNKTDFKRIIRNALDKDFSWSGGAKEYDNIYRTIMKE
ncbi:MAG: glycogen synthase [Candidatus Kapabacteria bacterium]|nr:glycogen synthase [Ignavibacteriota bacterium]MCW5885724.1 glycogen synthase [Candidatus Kapabacteria bacterium]